MLVVVYTVAMKYARCAVGPEEWQARDKMSVSLLWNACLAEQGTLVLEDYSRTGTGTGTDTDTDTDTRIALPVAAKQMRCAK